jgi:GNAT superfamily N-acetyltransferase
MDKWHIRKSTEEDINYITGWLKKEHSEGIDNHYSNLNIINAYHRENNIFILLINNEAIGYLAIAHFSISILGVKQNFRGIGAASYLVNYVEKYNYENFKIDSYRIDIAPHSAEPFWKKMGFRVFENLYRNEMYGYKFLSIEFNKKEYSVECEIEFIFYDQSGFGEVGRFTKQSFGKADSLDFKFEKTVVYYFEKRVSNHNTIKISFNNEVIYNGYIKRDDVSDLGLNIKNEKVFYTNSLQLNKKALN